ncbi:MAG: sulfatase-like hydrolase/transferase, partial [Bacteroidota bacterium]
DDLGVDASQGYQQNPQMPSTPHLDSLRGAGLTFLEVWATPVCAPTRATIMSGKFGVKTGVTAVPGNLDTVHRSLFKELETRSQGLYASAYIGKWHLSNPVDLNHPQTHGIPYFEGLMRGNPGDYYNWARVVNGVEDTVTEYVTTYLTTQAIQWAQSQNQPWFLYLAHPAPHPPYHTPPTGTYTRPTPTNNRERYLASIEALDHEIGRLLDGLPPAVKANTVVIYLSDNGTPGAVLQNFPTGHGKGSLYQGGIHVPMIVSGKGVSRTQETESAMVHATDLHASILEIAGYDLPGGIHHSFSFAPLLSNASAPRRPYNYSEVDQNTMGWTIRNDQYKLIRFSDGQEEFYDLSTDPLETNNLMGSLNAAQMAVKTELAAEANDIQNGWSCQDLIQNGAEPAIDSCDQLTCDYDNTLGLTNIGCCDSPQVSNFYGEQVQAEVREIQTVNYPSHRFCYNPNRQPTPINYRFEVDATPSVAAQATAVIRANGRPARYFGVALNGVLLAPAPATPFIFENPETGEFNWDWVFEPTNNQGSGQDRVDLDCASGHTGGQGYHYHGNPFEFVEQLSPGISQATQPPNGLLQIGWASDGFPVLYRFGPDGIGGLKQ